MFFNGEDHRFFSISTVLLLLTLSITSLRSPSGIPNLPATPFFLAASAYWLWLALTQLWSIAPSLSWVASWWHAGIILAFVVAIQPNTVSWSVLRPALQLGGLILVVAIGIQAHSDTGSPHGTFFNKNNTAAFITLLLLPTLAEFFSNTEQRYRSLNLYFFVLMMANAYALGLVGSRGALLGFIAGVAFITAHAYRLRILTWGHSVMAILAYFIGFMVVNLELSGGLVSRIATLASPAMAGHERMLIWQSALRMLSDGPWYGIGAGTLHLPYRQYRAPEETSYGAYVHNDYLQIAIEYGLPGLILLILLVTGIFLLWRKYCVTTSATMRGAGMIGAIVAIAVHSGFTFNFFILPILFVSGFYLAWLHNAAYTDTLPLLRRILGIRPMAARVMTSSVIAIAMISLLALGAAEHLKEKAVDAAQVGDLGRTEKLLMDAERLAPYWEEIKAYKAWFYIEAMKHPGIPAERKERLFLLAKENISAATALSPMAAENYFLSGRLYDIRGNDISDNMRSASAYEMAVKLHPSNHLYRLVTVRMMKKLDRWEDANILLREGQKYTFHESDITRAYYRDYTNDILDRFNHEGALR